MAEIELEIAIETNKLYLQSPVSQTSSHAITTDPPKCPGLGLDVFSVTVIVSISNINRGSPLIFKFIDNSV